MIAIEYGSRHNGVVSRYSDRDLLLIHHGWKYAKGEKRKFQLLGYDVTVMNEQKAMYLANAGSLFLKHVIDEGKVISGDVDIYEKVGFLWKAKNDYQYEIDSNIDILELLETLPENKFSLLFVNDLLITSIRNISIRKFAAQGIYVFDWEGIFNQLYNHGWINKGEVKVLLCARKLKNAYRLKMYYDIEFSFISTLMKIAKKIIKFHCRLKFCNRKSTILGLPEKFQERSYKQLRAYEVVCSFYQFRDDVSDIASMVSNPSYFSNSDIGNDFG
ncbi:hypothetical protein XF56_002926 [Salmonella enterica subsp. enterica serovar Java]|nr:hypothetical protein [Salmonella enterica subsp. enterica serovar Java]EBX3467900.1 hypothetical protein [Salmonella enterica subsp. enterica serovar Java]ECF2603162.1 hypothetical protein [Salmonella enterica subsp. enterica serovar Java]ECG4501668.1 hypothetical protein [Salmonella enterica subsp. enterica serovar Java]EDR3659074.1 hypothetical protein [Salmonella enterica subsp. enterica serovar Java]